MITAIIPCHTPNNIRDIVAKLHAQQCEIVVVLDRIQCELPEYVHVVTNDEGDGFLAGKCRDIGLVEAEKYGDEFVFLDDDCIPQENFIASHKKWLELTCPLVTLGRRIEKEYNWKDRREVFDSVYNLDLFSKTGTMVNNASLINNCSALWSCNFGLNRKGLTLIRRMMARYFNTDRIFNPAFDGNWGGEDSFLAYIAWSSRVNMFFMPKGANGVVHIDHMRPANIYNKTHAAVLKEEVAKLSKKLATDPLNPEFFAI